MKTASLTPHPASEIGIIEINKAGGTSANASNGDIDIPRATAKQSTMATRQRWLHALHEMILIVFFLPKSARLKSFESWKEVPVSAVVGMKRSHK